MLGSVAADNDWSVFDENAWLGIYGLLAVAAAGLVGRLLLQVGQIRFRHRLSPYAVAYLAGEAKHMTYAALAALRVYGTVSVTRHEIRLPTLHVTGPPPPHADPVELAVHRAVSRDVFAKYLHLSPEVGAAVEPVVDQLRRDGLLFTRRRRRVTRTVSVIGGIGAVLVGTCVALVGVVLIFSPVGERSFVAMRVLRNRRKRRRLDPNWRRLGPAEARMIVAVHGEEALRVGDPDLADALDIPRPSAASGDSGDGSDGYDGPGYRPSADDGDGGGDD